MTGLDRAWRRLGAAMDAFDSVVEERQGAEHQTASLRDEIDLITADRARLAAELDRVVARLAGLEKRNREVSRRLGAVIDSIRRVLSSERAEG